MRTEGRVDGLAPFYVDPSNGVLSGGVMTLGARGDSYYEYMLKQWLMSGKQQHSFSRCAHTTDASFAYFIQMIINTTAADCIVDSQRKVG